MRAPIVVGILLAATAARADGIDLVPKLGFTVGYGGLPIHAQETRATTLGLDVEHPAWGQTRAFGDWEWMWLADADATGAMAAGRDVVHGSGQRALAGLRRALVVGGDHELRYFLDGEAGGGAMLADDNTMGTHVNGVGLVGLRLGINLRNGDSSSRVWQLDVGLRAILVPNDYGVAFGVGMAWGD